MGEVKSAGAYAITTPRPVLDILALAGGLTPEADRHVFIARQADPDHPLHYYVSNDARDALSTDRPGLSWRHDRGAQSRSLYISSAM